MKHTAAIVVLVLTGSMILSACSRKTHQTAHVPPDLRTSTRPVESEASSPAPATSGQPVDGVLAPVFFNFDSYTLDEDGRAGLDANARYLREQPHAEVVIEGHCDERGTIEYNQALESVVPRQPWTTSSLPDATVPEYARSPSGRSAPSSTVTTSGHGHRTAALTSSIRRSSLEAVFMNHARHLWPYLVAVAITLGVAVVRLPLPPLTVDVAPYIPFVVSVMITASYGGLRPGVLATLFGVLLGTYLYVPPYFSLEIQEVGEWIAVSFFLIAGITLSWICGALHISRRHPENKRRKLEQEVIERERS